MQDASVAFGKFHLLEEVGRGPLSTVHRAVLRGLKGFERQVAIKRMLPELSQQDNFIHAFIGQAKLLALLDHTNIVKIYDFGRVDDRYFIAMEYVEEGEPLERYCGRSLPPEDAAHLMEQICSALQYAHERGLVHGDLNPSNILLCDYSAKLMDFGIAQIERVAMPQSRNRKWGYLSPEQVEGNLPTPWSDIFSAGAILWELLTGEPLFEGFAPHVTLGNILKTAVPPIAEYQPDFRNADQFDAICQRALARQPSDRYHDAAEMADDLIAVLKRSRAGLYLLYGGGTKARARVLEPRPGQIEHPASTDTLDEMTLTDAPATRDAGPQLISAAEAATQPGEPPEIGATGPHRVSEAEAATQPGEPPEIGDTGPQLISAEAVTRPGDPPEVGNTVAPDISAEMPTQPDEPAEVGSTGPHLPEPLPELPKVGTGPRRPEPLPELPKVVGTSRTLEKDTTPEAGQKALSPDDDLDNASTQVRGLKAVDNLTDWEQAKTAVASRPIVKCLDRPLTGPHLPADDPRVDDRQDAPDADADADVVSPLRARAMSSMLRTMAERSHLHAEQSQRRRSIIFVLCGILLVSLLTNVVQLMRSGSAAPKEPVLSTELARPDKRRAVQPDATHLSAPVVPLRVEQPQPQATNDAAATTPSPTRADGSLCPNGDVSRPTRYEPTLRAETKQAIQSALLGRRLHRLLKPCGLKDGLQIGVRIGAAGKVRRVVVPNQSPALQQCARSRLLKVQLNVVLPRQTYMEWRFSPSGVNLLRFRPL